MGKLTDQALALAGFTYVVEGAAYVPPPPVPKGATTTENAKPSCDSAPPSTDLIPSFGVADTQYTMHSCAKDTRTQDRFCLFSNICWKDGKFTYFRNPKVHLPWGDTNEFTEMQGFLNIMTDAIKPTLADVTPQVFAPPAFVDSPIPAVFTRGKTDTTTFLAVNSRFVNLGHRLGDNVWPYLRSVEAFGGGWAPGRRTEVVLVNSCKPGSTKAECERYQAMAWRPLSSKPLQYLDKMNNHCFSKLIVGTSKGSFILGSQFPDPGKL